MRDRRDIESRLDAVVRENRFTIAVVFPAVGAVLLVASAEGWLPDLLTFNPWLLLAGIAVMRSPLIVGLVPVFDRRAVAGISLLAVYAYAIEFVGVHTGWPYGAFAYGVALGPTVFGVPLALPLLFLPLVANAYLLCRLLLGERSIAVRLAVVISTVVATDLVLDPGAVALGFWTYAAGGVYHGVPLSNFLGWILSATVTVAVFDRAVDSDTLRARLTDCEFLLDDLVSFVLLWGGVNAWFGQPAPVAVATLFGAGLIRADRFDAAPFLPWSAGG
jgi:putative membrane protein